MVGAPLLKGGFGCSVKIKALLEAFEGEHRPRMPAQEGFGGGADWRLLQGEGGGQSVQKSRSPQGSHGPQHPVGIPQVPPLKKLLRLGGKAHRPAAKALRPPGRGEGGEPLSRRQGAQGIAAVLCQLGGYPRQHAPRNQGQLPAEAGKGIPAFLAKAFQLRQSFQGCKGLGTAPWGNLPLEVLPQSPVEPNQQGNRPLLFRGRPPQAHKVQKGGAFPVVHQGNALLLPPLPLPGHSAFGGLRPAEDQSGGVPLLFAPVPSGTIQMLQGAPGVLEALPAVYTGKMGVAGPVIVVLPGGVEIP